MGKDQEHPEKHQAGTAMRSTINWHAFWRHHLGEWNGRWTRYSPSGEVVETFGSTRSFSADPARMAIAQINRYRHPDGRSITEQWKYNIKDHSHKEGFAHPASESMRGIAFDNGAAAWLIPHHQGNQFFPFELFLMRGDIRHSVGVVYGRDGLLLRTASIREHRQNPLEIPWSSATEQVDPWMIDGQWQGKERQICPDLTRLPVQASRWKWEAIESTEHQSDHFFPDQIILRCPDRLIKGQPFSITVYWLESKQQLQTIGTSYNAEAILIAIKHQTLTPLP